MKFPSEAERQHIAELSIAHMSQRASTPESIRAAVQELAANFPSVESRRIASDALRELLQSDTRVAPEERTILAVVQQVFQL